jgi:hypothetical protein
MNQRQDLTTAVMQRERSRNRIRLLTVTAGAASLATAGVVAYNLPGVAHTATANKTVTTTPAATQPSAEAGDSGDDGVNSAATATTAPASSASQAPAHTASGGS